MPDLDERQQRAVDAGPRDLFIAAGAGSGKTRVLTARFIAAVLGGPPYEPTSPDALLTVTYTDKAAGELKERMRRGLIEADRPDAARRVSEAWISTIHGMCSRIMRRHALDIGIDPRFAVLDGVESSVLETEVLDLALGVLIEEDPTLAEMVGLLSFPRVAAALHAARSDLLANGLDVADLQVMAAEEVDRRCRELAAQAHDLVEGFAGLRESKTVAGNAEAGRALAKTLDQLMRAGLKGEDALELLGTVSFRQQRAIEGHEELVDEAKTLLETARMCAAQLAVAPYETSFIRALKRFTDLYDAEKRTRGALDFEDLQTLTARLLRERPDVAQRYQRHFAMVMVDEFQDTNALQLGIIERLADGDLCTVGDENQSIYAFRHADVEVFRAHGRSVAEHVELDINYRIAPPLLDAINGLFAHPLLLGGTHMTLRSPALPQNRRVWPEALSRFAVKFVDTATSEAQPYAAEAVAIAERVAEYAAHGIDPGSVAVLLGALSRGQGAAVERELAARGIPAVLAAGGAFFECQEIEEVRALFRVIGNVHDDGAVLTILAGRLTGLSADALHSIRAQADLERAAPGSEGTVRRRLSLWEALHRALDVLADDERAAAQRMIAAVNSARLSYGVRSLGEGVVETLLELDYDLVLFGEGRSGVRAWANVMKLVRMADEYESAGSGGLSGFLHQLDLREMHSKGEQEATLDAATDAVRIMSIHAAKGLEFPFVIVGSLTSDPTPPAISLARTDGSMMLGMELPLGEGKVKTLAWHAVARSNAEVSDAERYRLFYVACTRAKEGLTVMGRTRSDRAAGGSTVDILRTVFGMDEPGTLASRDIVLGGGTISASVVEGVAETGHVPSVGRVPEAPVPEPSPGASSLPTGVAPVPSGGSDPSMPPVSYTALATYERCPYHYHLVRVARLPVPVRVDATAALDFGSALHLVLQRASEAAQLHPIIDTALTAMGLGPAQRPALEQAATAFLCSPLAGRLREAERVEHEAPFLVPLAGTVLSGAIDVIAWDGSSALIVDYKTGAGALDVEVARDRYRLQSECYALAALHAGARQVETVFAEVERGRTIAFSYDTDDHASLVERISAPVLSIARGEFAPLDTYVRGLCDTCPGFGGLCPVTRAESDASA